MGRYSSAIPHASSNHVRQPLPGWNVPGSGNSPAWSHANRVADYMAANPDIISFLGSQSDAGNSALTTAVASVLNQLLAALPNTLFIGVGSVISGATAPFPKAGFLAENDQKRCQYRQHELGIWRWRRLYPRDRSRQQGLDGCLRSATASWRQYGLVQLCHRRAGGERADCRCCVVHSLQDRPRVANRLIREFLVRAYGFLAVLFFALIFIPFGLCLTRLNAVMSMSDLSVGLLGRSVTTTVAENGSLPVLDRNR
ncbi:hypothetical protein ACVWYH_005677 [Bradyrhizobium sp. GM24.11]